MVFLLVFTLLSSAVSVAPGSACPAGDAISAELERLGALSALKELGTAEVMVQGASLNIVVRDHQSVVLGERAVDAPAECDARAAVAGVLIAAWAGDWARTRLASSESAGRPASSSEAPIGRPAPLSEPKPAASPLAPVLAPVPATPVAALPSPAATRGAGSPPSRPAQKSLGVGLAGFDLALLGSGVHDGDVGAFAFGGLGMLRGRRYSLIGLVESVGDRDRTLGQGRASYGSLRIGVGASVRKAWSRAFVELALVPELARYSLQGRNLITTRQVTAWGPLVDARGYAGLRLGRWAPFAYLGTSYALMRERLTLDEPPDATTLSRVNIAAGLGISFSLWSASK